MMARLWAQAFQRVSPMTATPDDHSGFAPDDDVPIAYMARTRAYYQAIGYETPYRWAHHVTSPFQPLRKPLARARVAIVTTAAPFDPAKGDQGPGAKYNGGAKFYAVYDGDSAVDHDLRISHIAYDRVHTSAEDSGTWFPLPQLRRLAAEGRIGEVAPRFFGAPTNRSHRVTLETDAPEILARCRADGVDAAVLVPNCPVCHQTVALTARHLEANGISTVVMGAARDIVEHAAVPRFLFSDFPLGNSAGKPHDKASQAATLEAALRLLESANDPQTTVQNQQRWSSDPSWKRDYNNVALLSAEELARRRADFEAQKAVARGLRAPAA
jgi:D-proline reductase (dithiol) PrdB